MRPEFQLLDSVSQPPQLPVSFVPRPYLTSLIQDSLQVSSIVLLHAPTGYGKTTLLSEIYQTSGPTVYLSLDTDRVEPEFVLDAFLGHFNATYPELLTEIKTVYTQTRRFDAAFRRLTDRIGGSASPCLVMLDDYPVKRIPGIEALEYILNHRLPSWRFIIASRGKPDLPWARWSASGQLTVFKDTQLRFTTEESAELVSNVLAYPLTPEDISVIETDYEGWPLGLKLLADSLREMATSEISRILHVLHHERGLIMTTYDYLEHEVLREFDTHETEQTFLLYTSILADLQTDICNSLLDIENAGEILGRLHRRGIFLRSQDQAGASYTYHPTFSMFLQQVLRQRRGPATIQAQHRRAAQIYEDQDNWSRAVDHYLAGRAYDDAVRLIEQNIAYLSPVAHGRVYQDETHGHSYHINGIAPTGDRAFFDLATVERWIDALPPEKRKAYPILSSLHDPQQTNGKQHSLIANARPTIDDLAQRATTDYLQGRHEAPVEYLRQALSAVDLDPAQRAELLLCLSTHLGALIRHREAIEVVEEGLMTIARVSPREVKLDLELRLARHAAYLYRDVGELYIAQEMSDRAVSISAIEGVGDEKALEQSLRAHLLMLIARGDFQATLRFENQRLSLRNDPSTLSNPPSYYALLRARIAMVEGDYAAAEDWLLLVEDVGSDLTHLLFLQGRYPQALDQAQRELAQQPAGRNRLGHAVAQTWLGIVAAHSGDKKLARHHLDEAIDFFTTHDLMFWRAGAQLHRAWLVRADDRELARQDIAEAMSFGARFSAFYFTFWCPSVVLFACTEATTVQLHLPYAQELLRRRVKRDRAKETATTLGPGARPETNGHGALRTAQTFAETSWTSAPSEDASALALHPSIERLIENGSLSRECAIKLVVQYHLTPREIEVLGLYLEPDVRGTWRRVNEAIADRLALSEVTVRDYISNILKKLDLSGRDRLKIRAWAIQNGLIST